MSLPKHPPSHSSSPSKSSLRSTSGASTNKPPTPRALLPSPHFAEPVLAHAHAAGEGEEEEREEDEDAEVDPEACELDGSSFQPFFTLIEDTLTHAHHHPTVHYIFADDDTAIVTEAACRSLAHEDPFVAAAATSSGGPGGQQHDPDSEPEPSGLAASTPGVREHYLLLDVQPVTASESTTTSYEVTRAHSLSAQWQVTSTSISSAPTFDAGDEGAEGADGLMLRIEGRGTTPLEDDEAGNGKTKAVRENETVEEMVRRFETGLADIRRAVEAGGSLEQEHEQEDEQEEGAN